MFSYEGEIIKMFFNNPENSEDSGKSLLFRILFYPLVGYFIIDSYKKEFILLPIMYLIIFVQHIISDIDMKNSFSYDNHIYPLLMGLVFMHISDLYHAKLVGGIMVYIHTLSIIRHT